MTAPRCILRVSLVPPPGCLVDATAEAKKRRNAVGCGPAGIVTVSGLPPARPRGGRGCSRAPWRGENA